MNISQHGRLTARPYPELPDRKLPTWDTTLVCQLGSRLRKFVPRRDTLQQLQKAVAMQGSHIELLSDIEIASAARLLRSRLLAHGFTPGLMAQSFALTSELMHRKLEIRPYPVQIRGAANLVQGHFVEMETGEGKTFTGALAAATAALAGKQVHVITVNDYLAARDAELLRPIYEGVGLSVGVVQHDHDEHARRAAYASDITYVVNKEVAFDYLRDGITLGAQRSQSGRLAKQMMGIPQQPLLLSGLSFAIIDEADSVLIDEARTPLIISQADQSTLDAEEYKRSLNVARQLRLGEHFILEREREVRLLPAGSAILSRLTSEWGGMWAARKARDQLVLNALNALYRYHRDTQYVVLNGKIQIVDEFTGRIADGRSWQHGLHQMIEAKENCEITAENKVAATITYQRFFARYLHLCGMSGTLSEVAGELETVYGREVRRVPTHRPSQRKSSGVWIFKDAERKWGAVVNSIKVHLAQQRPLLIGTRSIQASETLSELLGAHSIPHVVLNAHQDKKEADIIAQAGLTRRVTVATNMAGRGTDIKLGAKVAAAGGLHVILTEFHESARVDRQFFGRGARQGDPGSFEVIASLEDELFATFAMRSSQLTRTLARSRRLPRLLTYLIRWKAQGHAEAVHSRARRRTLHLQHERDKSLAFALPD